MHKTCYKKTVSTSYDGQRLDKYLAEQIVGISRTRIKFLIEDGKVNINNQKITDPASVSYTHLTLPTICSV